MMKTFICIIGVILVLCVCLGVYAYKETNDFQESDLILSNVSIDCIDIGNLPKSQGKKIILDYTNKILDKKFVVRVNNKLYNPTYRDLGYSFNVNEAIEKAYSIGRSGNVLEDTLLIHKLGNYNINLVKSRDDNKVKKYINDLSQKIGVKSKNASLYKSGGSIVIKPETSGICLDKEKAYSDIINALDNDKGQVTLVCKKDIPNVKEKDLKTINKKLSSFSTKYNPGKKNRSENLSIACKKINNTIVMPGETFSFNGVVGPRTEATGFKNAIVFQDGEEVEGMGGGICQVSSTMFNAVLLTDLKVVSRRSHSLKVAYVPLGQDAMVSYGSSDFKFRNNSSYPIALFASAFGGTMSFEIWGNSSVWKKCKVVQEKGPDGFSAKVTRYVYSPNGDCKADYVTTSKYMKPKEKKEVKDKKNNSL